MRPETAGEMVKMAVTNMPMQAMKIDAERTTALWYGAFKGVEDSQMITAMILALKTAYDFPTISDIRRAIDELRADLRYKNPEQTKLLEAGERPYNPAISALIQGMIANRHVEMPEKLRAEIVADVRDYARSLFPEASDELIRRNHLELRFAMERIDMCKRCLWLPKDCTQGGYVPVVRLQKDGWMHTTMAPCQKRRAG